MPLLTEFNLQQRINDKIDELGTKEAAKFFGRTESLVKKWQATTAAPGVEEAQKVLDEVLASGEGTLYFADAPEQGETIPAKDQGEPERVGGVIGDAAPGEKPKLLEPSKLMDGARRISFLTPVNRDMSYAVVLSMLGNWKSTLPHEIRALLANMDFEPDTLVHRARNILAMRFLASGNEWSFWLDSDVVAPIGHPGWFKKRTGSKWDDKWFSRSALERLTTRGKTIVGAVYAERNTSGRIIAQPGLSPSGDGDKKLIDDIKLNGPKDEVIPVPWVGFGCVAVHRTVFEAMLANVPDVKAKVEGQPHNFFNAIEGGPQGEDVAFCKRAADCGHPTFLDLSVHCGHVGKFSYMP